MLPVLDGHLTAPAAAEDRGGALWAPWVSSLATTPALSKGLLTGGGWASHPAGVSQGNSPLLCWQAQSTCTNVHSLRALASNFSGLSPRPPKKGEIKFRAAEHFDCSFLSSIFWLAIRHDGDDRAGTTSSPAVWFSKQNNTYISSS